MEKGNFSPIHVNWSALGIDRLAHLYKFGRLVFPGLPSHSLFKTLLDLENEMHRVFLQTGPEEREEIRKGLQGITLELKIAIQDKEAGEIVSLPICIEPSAVIERGILGKGEGLDLKCELSEIKKAFFESLKAEFFGKMKNLFGGFFKGEMAKGEVKEGVKELVDAGAITPDGELPPETTIDDLVFGKYAPLFAKATTREIINEGHLIQETLSGLFDWAELKTEEWAAHSREEMERIRETLETLGTNE